MKKIQNTVIVLLIIFPFIRLNGQDKEFKILFRQNISKVDPLFSNNYKTLDMLADYLNKIEKDSMLVVSQVKFSASASPEGRYFDNKILAQSRLASVEKYVRNRVKINDSIIHRSNEHIGWSQLAKMVQTLNIQDKKQILDIIENVQEIITGENGKWIDGKKKRLMDLSNGKAWRYMERNFFPSMRNGSAVTVCVSPSPLAIKKAVNRKDSASCKIMNLNIYNIKELNIYNNGYKRNEKNISDNVERKPVLGVKTNLLFDVLLFPNIEIEYPFAKRWSIMGEWTFPWYLSGDNSKALQILSGGLEGRYWFGNRKDRRAMTGWFGGVYSGGGLYDIRDKGKGYQGEFYIAAGISMGYGLKVNDNINFEFSLGFGYLGTKYRYYEAENNYHDLIWKHDGRYTWIGPTKAKISFVWLFNKKVKQGR